MKEGVQAGVSVRLMPPDQGSHWSLRPKIRMNIIPTQKYGIAEVITSSGGAMLSVSPPCRQAERMPIPVPSVNARIVVTPTRPSVQNTAVPTTWLTGEGK
jgi:hypothetical protein